MTAKYCSSCGSAITGDVAFCSNCGKATTKELPVAEVQTRENKKRPYVLIVLATFVGLALLGNLRFVSGAPGFIVLRENFGLSGMFGSVADCTAKPWIVAVATNGPFCKDLQSAGLIESDADFERRIQQEMAVDLEQTMKEIGKQMDAAQKDLTRDMEKLEQSMQQDWEREMKELDQSWGLEQERIDREVQKELAEMQREIEWASHN